MSTVTFVNLFDVAPERQPELLALLDEGISSFFGHRPGFISARALAALDGTRVVYEAVWENTESIVATQAEPLAAEFARRAAAIATPNPAPYRLHAMYPTLG